MTGSFLQEPPMSPQVQALYDEDLADGGYVWNGSRLWAYQPDTLDRLFEAMSLVGGYFGGRLAQAGADVHFIARGALLQALREHDRQCAASKATSTCRHRPPMTRLTSAGATLCCSASRPSTLTPPRPGWAPDR